MTSLYKSDLQDLLEQQTTTPKTLWWEAPRILNTTTSTLKWDHPNPSLWDLLTCNARAVIKWACMFILCLHSMLMHTCARLTQCMWERTGTGQRPPNQPQRDWVRRGMQRNIVKASNKRTKVRMCPGLSATWVCVSVRRFPSGEIHINLSLYVTVSASEKTTAELYEYCGQL